MLHIKKLKPSLKRKLYFWMNRPLPVIKNTVLFESFKGQYNDNPKYISLKLHEMNPDINITWVISDKAKLDDIPDYVRKISLESKEYYKYISRAQVIVDNMDGIRGFVSSVPKRFLSRSIKRKDQLNISTWHGTPLKKIGLDMPNMSNYKYMYTSAEYITAGCEYTQKRFKQAFYPLNILQKGSPRNDLLINKDENICQKLKQKLGIPLDKKICLFAPTFRNSVEESGVRQMNEIDFSRLFQELHNKFGGEWIFVFRVHHEVQKKIDTKAICSKFGNDILIDGNQFDDMAEYLAVADVLLTDYSSSLFDFILTGLPCFLLMLDKEHYIETERGAYISLNELPYPIAGTVEELYKNISIYDFNESDEKITYFKKKIGNMEDGKASERIASDILAFIENKK